MEIVNLIWSFLFGLDILNFIIVFSDPALTFFYFFFIFGIKVFFPDRAEQRRYNFRNFRNLSYPFSILLIGFIFRPATRETAGSLIGALLFAPCVVALGMVSPFVIRLLSDETGHVGESTGKVFAVSTVGSLGGIFLSTLWLVPAIGSRSTVLLFSGVLAAVAIVILAWKRPAMGAALLVFAPLALGNATSIKHVAGSLGEWESGYQYIQVLEEGDTRKLSLNEGLDSFHSILVEGEYLTRGAYYDYYTAFPFLFDGQNRLDVAVLGGGGGTTARQYRHFFADRFNVHVDSVEIDPQVSEVGRRYFDYPTEGVDVFDLDARVFMNLTDATYDIVIVDAYANQVYIPFHVATKEFFERVHDRLGDRGVVAMNVGSFQPATPLVEALVRTVSEVFPNSYAMILPQSRNLLVFGMKGFEGVDPLLDFAMEPELGSIAASVALSSQPVRERFPGLDRARLLVDAHAPVERLTDRMVWSRVREVLR